jgi:hypothetical protein
MDGAQRHALAVTELATAFGAGVIQEFQRVLHRQFGVARFRGPGSPATVGAEASNDPRAATRVSRGRSPESNEPDNP